MKFVIRQNFACEPFRGLNKKKIRTTRGFLPSGYERMITLRLWPVLVILNNTLVITNINLCISPPEKSASANKNYKLNAESNVLFLIN